MIQAKTAQYKLLRIGNEKNLREISIFLTAKWIDVIDISRARDTMIVMKALVQNIIASVISIYALQCALEDCQEDILCLMNVACKSREKNVATIAAALNGHIRGSVEEPR